jgi:hypothetical protein
MSTEIKQKQPIIYECNLCDFRTRKKTNYETHLLTPKHKKKENINSLSTKSSQFEPNVNISCKNCNKEFKERTGLWRHLKKCKINNCSVNTCTQNTSNLNLENKNKDHIIELLIKQNNDLLKEQSDIKQIILEIVKNGPMSYNNNNNITNSYNKTFNLQVFLNETCKDAMNISDFIESVKLQVADLENVGKVGYIEGISNIIIKNLKALDIDKRQVHCADQKREVMYVKDENTWEKEDETNKKLRKAIRMIAHKNICMFKEFRETYPDCEEYDSKKNDLYNKIVYESMGGKGDNDYEKDTKIIKKIAKVVGIEKI